MGTWIERREEEDGARRIIGEKLRKHQCREGHGGSPESKRVELDGESNVERLWEQVK